MALRALARGLIVLAAAWSPVAPAAVLPQIDSFPSAAPLVVRYDLFFNGIFAAEVTETLSTDGAGAYRIESEARARGLAKILIGDILRKSEGLWEGESLRPLLYEEIRGKKRHYRAVVDRARETIDLIRKTTGRAETAPLPAAPLNDYLTAAYRSYAAGRALADESALTDGRRIKTYRYRRKRRIDRHGFRRFARGAGFSRRQAPRRRLARAGVALFAGAHGDRNRRRQIAD